MIYCFCSSEWLHRICFSPWLCRGPLLARDFVVWNGRFEEPEPVARIFVVGKTYSDWLWSFVVQKTLACEWLYGTWKGTFFESELVLCFLFGVNAAGLTLTSSRAEDFCLQKASPCEKRDSENISWSHGSFLLEKLTLIGFTFFVVQRVPACRRFHVLERVVLWIGVYLFNVFFGAY